MRALSKKEQDIISIIKSSLRESLKFGFIADYMSLILPDHKIYAERALNKLCPHSGAQKENLDSDDIQVIRKLMELISEPDTPFVNIIHPYHRKLAADYKMSWLYNLAHLGTPMVNVPSYLK
ncbi:hypothetical protein EI427_04005 [Flammeovirga pectinis]|uniref:Uncharacterized protein n=1 Tax=Flammeovirga pectinis TaxID=2494373 RepID=A0A3Q9FK07_9BACT|nr:hypothetical protein [Flammeovirga pectinis]AZQ61416.1 hypothetical protein EI427_04005 [Flammeovirga pectinis]